VLSSGLARTKNRDHVRSDHFSCATFEYPNGTRVQNELRVKAGQVVLLEVTSLDVIHSFFVYDLGVKIDANPGHVNNYWFRADTPGQYRIVCAEFCGVSHYAMIGKLIVEP